jgi:hypothetical protein
MIYLFLILLFITPCHADTNYVVNGGDVYKIETVPVEIERSDLKREILRINGDISSLEESIASQQTSLDGLKAEKKDAEDKLATLPAEVVPE